MKYKNTNHGNDNAADVKKGGKCNSGRGECGRLQRVCQASSCHHPQANTHSSFGGFAFLVFYIGKLICLTLMKSEMHILQECTGNVDFGRDSLSTRANCKRDAGGDGSSNHHHHHHHHHHRRHHYHHHHHHQRIANKIEVKIERSRRLKVS